jgi:putative membrane-bound dehydrogenase-like protein
VFSIEDTLGTSLLFFAAIWGLLSLYRIVRLPREERASGVLILVVTAIWVAIFVFLTMSTPTRRAYINLPMRELLFQLVRDGVALLLAGAAAFIIYRLAERLRQNSSLRFGIVAALGVVLVTAPITAWLYVTTFNPDLDEIVAEPTAIEDIEVADNLPIKFFENIVTQAPTAMLVGPEDELYVASLRGSIWVMEDADQDNVADSVREFATGLPQPAGLAWSEDGLYVSVVDRVLLLKDTDGDYTADETEVIADGFPGEVHAFHQTSGLTFGADGRLYIGVGATSDSDPERHPLAARVLSVNPDGSDLQVYATGTRNPFNIIPAPGGGFFAVENSASGCLDEACTQTFDVPEEINYITEGNDYGFPDYYGIPPEDSGTMPPVVTFTDHSAPTGLVIYEGDRFPESYRGQLFVTLWTSGEIWRVRLFRIDDEHFVGSARRFVSGLVGPSAIVNSPSGGLYVASFTGNAIYHIG